MDNTFVMGKSIKAYFAMISADSAVLYSAKAKTIICQMHNSIVNAAAAKPAMRQHIILITFGIGKDIKCKWMGELVDIF